MTPKQNAPKSSRVEMAVARRATAAVESFRTVTEALAGVPLEPGFSAFGVTRGQFSMIDVIRYYVERLSPCRVSVWTWAIAAYEVEAFEYFYIEKRITAARLIVDRSAEERNAELIDRWRSRFGADAVRVCKTHAKIATIEGAGLRVLARGSMNLNQNPRFEQFDVSEGGAPFELIRRLEDEIEVLPARCSNRDADRATGLQMAWTDDQLKPFGGTTVWAR